MRTCDDGCNGCDECTDYDDPENDPPACEASDWVPPAGYDGDGSVAAMADRATALALLSAAAKSGDPGAMSLAAQLAGVAPCKGCGFVRTHCRCKQPN